MRLVAADYSNLEVRVFTHFSQVQLLLVFCQYIRKGQGEKDTNAYSQV